MCQVLDRAVKSMDLPESSIAGEPSVEGAVRSTIGYAYLGLGVYPEAEKQLRRAYVLLIASDAPMEDVLFARNRALWARALSGRFVILGELDQTLKMAEMYLGASTPRLFTPRRIWRRSTGGLTGRCRFSGRTWKSSAAATASSTSSPCALPATWWLHCGTAGPMPSLPRPSPSRERPAKPGCGGSGLNFRKPSPPSRSAA